MIRSMFLYTKHVKVKIEIELFHRIRTLQYETSFRYHSKTSNDVRKGKYFTDDRTISVIPSFSSRNRTVFQLIQRNVSRHERSRSYFRRVYTQREMNF